MVCLYVIFSRIDSRNESSFELHVNPIQLRAMIAGYVLKLLHGIGKILPGVT